MPKAGCLSSVSLDPRIPEGVYVCKVVKVEEGTTKDGDAETWRLHLAVVGGEHDGVRLFDSLIWSEKALKRTKLVLHRLAVLGYDVDDEEAEYKSELLVDALVNVTVVDDEYNGRVRSRVAFDGLDIAVPGTTTDEFRKSEAEQAVGEREEAAERTSATAGGEKAVAAVAGKEEFPDAVPL
jgi:hypothetical protein